MKVYNTEKEIAEDYAGFTPESAWLRLTKYKNFNKKDYSWYIAGVYKNSTQSIYKWRHSNDEEGL